MGECCLEADKSVHLQAEFEMLSALIIIIKPLVTLNEVGGATVEVSLNATRATGE